MSTENEIDTSDEPVTLASELEAQRLQLFKAMGILDCIMHSLHRSTIPNRRAGPS
jgi:hypothetical protein